MSFIKYIQQYFVRYQFWVVVMFFAIFALTFTRPYVDTTNNSSRFMTMQSIVEHGTITISDQHFYTDDKIFREGNFYSSKPPVLSIAGAGIYFVLHNVFDLDIHILEQSWAIYFLNIILTGGSFFLLLFILYKIIKLLDVRQEYRLLVLSGFAVGTLFFSYFISLNNHTIAGSMLLLGFYFLLKLKLKESSNYKKYIGLAGFFLSLAAVIDLPTGLAFLGLFFVYCLVVFPKKYLIYYALAALPMLILHLAFNYQVTGDFLPPQLHLEFWRPEDVARILASRSNVVVYLINILVGTHGLFSYTPILLFAAYSMYRILKNKDSKFRVEALIVFTGFLIIALYYTFKVRIYTGAAFGYRWFMAITPLIYFFLLVLFTKKRSQRFLGLFFVAMVFSVAVALIGFLSPWGGSVVNVLLPNGEMSKFEFPLLANIIELLK
jgi:hypothetical protein